jgi:hypothetical protein
LGETGQCNRKHGQLSPAGARHGTVRYGSCLGLIAGHDTTYLEQLGQAQWEARLALHSPSIKIIFILIFKVKLYF